jgi:hypothetical protein
MIEKLVCQQKNMDEQVEIMDTIEEHSMLQKEINKARDEKRRLRSLKKEMESQQKGWLRNLQEIHSQERAELIARINHAENERDKAISVLSAAEKMYEGSFANAMREVKEARGALSALIKFHEKATGSAHTETSRFEKNRRRAAERLRLYKNGRDGTVFSQKCYNAGKAAHEFLRGKSSALESWLVSRTKFTEDDRAGYLERVEQVKRKRDEYDDNVMLLSRQLERASLDVEKTQHSYDSELARNNDLRQTLVRPQERIHNEALAKSLVQNIKDLQDDISVGKMQRLKFETKLYPKTHQLNMERNRIRTLQVELGELGVLLEDVKHHKRVERIIDARLRNSGKDVATR